MGRNVVALAALAIVAVVIACGPSGGANDDVKGPRVVPNCEACDSHQWCYEGPPLRCEEFTVCGASCDCALRDVDRKTHRCSVVAGQVRVSRRPAR